MAIDVNDGYVPLFRKCLDSQAFQDAELWKAWCWCLLKASYKERWISIKAGRGDIQIKLKEGQFIFGRKSAAKELRMKPSSVRNRMQKLENMQNLDIQADTHFSIVTICNWNVYKELMFRDRTGNRTTKGQPKDTNNKVNKVNNINNAHFEQLWSKYPNKVSKHKAQEKFIDSVKTEEDHALINKALENYKKHLELNTWKKVQDGKTWFNDKEWRSWISYQEPQEKKGKGWL